MNNVLKLIGYEQWCAKTRLWTMMLKLIGYVLKLIGYEQWCAKTNRLWTMMC